jgi:L-amino acid N-acyltransferase YncA
MVIRPFTPRDVAAACTLTNHFIERTAIHFGSRPATEQEFHDAYDAARPTYPWLAAETGGRVVGYAKAGAWRPRDAYALTAEVTVYVDPAFHRRGTGRSLYTELLRNLRDRGFHTAVAGIALPNPGSIALHQALGFDHVGTFRQVGRKFDRWHDVSWWQLMLGHPGPDQRGA